MAAKGLQVLAVKSLAGCGGDQVVVLLILGEGTASAGKGSGKHSSGLHFGSVWFIVDMLGGDMMGSM